MAANPRPLVTPSETAEIDRKAIKLTVANASVAAKGRCAGTRIIVASHAMNYTSIIDRRTRFTFWVALSDLAQKAGLTVWWMDGDGRRCCFVVGV